MRVFERDASSDDARRRVLGKRLFQLEFNPTGRVMRSS
jgi:hypothetical protein